MWPELSTLASAHSRRPPVVVVTPRLDARHLAAQELVEHEHRGVSCRRTLGERADLHRDPHRYGATTAHAPNRGRDPPRRSRTSRVVGGDGSSLRSTHRGGPPTASPSPDRVQVELVAQLDVADGPGPGGRGVDTPFRRLSHRTVSRANARRARQPACSSWQPGAQTVGSAAATSGGDDAGTRPFIEQLAMGRVRQFGGEVRVHVVSVELQRVLCKYFFAIVPLQLVTRGVPACGRSQAAALARALANLEDLGVGNAGRRRSRP